MDNCRNKQFINFKLSVLSSTIRFFSAPLHPTWDVNHPFCPVYPSGTCYPPVGHFVAALIVRSTTVVAQYLCSHDPYFHYGQKCKNSVAGNFDTSKRNYKVVYLSEKENSWPKKVCWHFISQESTARYCKSKRETTFT